MNGLEIRQQLNIAEAVTGCEAKNKYNVHNWNPNAPDVPGPFVMYIHEGEGDGCERVCCKQNRHLVLLIHEGTDQSADVIMQIHKSFGLAGLCCCRPSVQIFDGQANKIGHVDGKYSRSLCVFFRGSKKRLHRPLPLLRDGPAHLRRRRPPDLRRRGLRLPDGHLLPVPRHC